MVIICVKILIFAKNDIFSSQVTETSGHNIRSETLIYHLADCLGSSKDALWCYNPPGLVSNRIASHKIMKELSHLANCQKHNPPFQKSPTNSTYEYVCTPLDSRVAIETRYSASPIVSSERSTRRIPSILRTIRTRSQRRTTHVVSGLLPARRFDSPHFVAVFWPTM